MGVLIETSVLIAFERSGTEIERGVRHLIERLEGHEMYISAITVSELLHGVHRAGSARGRAIRSAFVERMLDEIPMLPIDRPTARAHAELWAVMANEGRALGAHDLWIAAAAIARGLLLVTLDARFREVPGLEVEVLSSAP